MPAFVTLLRGVNVGKANRVPMVEFRKLLESLGYTHVSTLLNSGNAVFQASTGTPRKHAADIAAAILRRLKVDVPVIVKTASELAAIAAGNPFAVDGSERSRMLVAFTQDRDALASVSSVASLVSPREKFLAGRHAAYLYCTDGILESKAGAALLGKAGKRATTRNLATTLKLCELAHAAEAPRSVPGATGKRKH